VPNTFWRRPGSTATQGRASFAADAAERSFREGTDSIMRERFAPGGNASKRNEGPASTLP
jgi:hypothetical protein